MGDFTQICYLLPSLLMENLINKINKYIYAILETESHQYYVILETESHPRQIHS